MRRFVRPSIALAVAIGLSALQTVLEEGNKDDWFSSPFIIKLSIVAFVFLAAFIWIELTVKKPLVKLSLLTQRNFGIGVAVNVLVGCGRPAFRAAG